MCMCTLCIFLHVTVCWQQAMVILCCVELQKDLHGSQTTIQSTSQHVMIPRLHRAVNVLTLKTLLMPGSGGMMKSEI